jgi:3-dehydroquinate dehydratase
MEQIENLVTICTLIISITTIINVALVLKGRVEAPEKNQNERLDVLEKRVDELESEIEESNKILLELEEGSRVTHRALLALMSHALNGNNIEKLEKAYNKLENHLVERGHHE